MFQVPSPPVWPALALLLVGCRGQLEQIGWYVDAGEPVGPGAPAVPAPVTPAGAPGPGMPEAPVRAPDAAPMPSAGESGPSSPTGSAMPAPPMPTEAPTPAPVPRPRTALLVVGNAGNTSAADEALQKSLEAGAFAVTLADDGAASEVGPAVGIVVISSSASSSAVAGKYRDTAAPVIVLDAYIFDDMAMTGGAQDTDFGTKSGTSVVARAEEPILSGGLREAVTVAGAAGSLNWGKPAPSAHVGATLLDAPDRATLFGYERGADMVGSKAPARRVGFFASETLATRINDDGLKLFRAAIEWAFLPDTK